MIPSPPCIHRGSQFHSLAPLGDPGAQQQRAQVLLHGEWADVEVSANFLVAVSLRQQPQDVFIPGSNFDGVQIDHDCYRS
jgi:hypothetical protein